MSAPPGAVRTHGLSRRLGSFALRDVSLTVPAGSVYALLGPNGAGKTTTLRLMMGLLRADAGEVEIAGIDARRRGPEARAKVGYVPDRPAIPDWMTAGQAMRHHAVFFPGWDAGYAGDLARRLGVDPARRVRQLSKGEAARLALLLALAHRPPVLLLDEPTTYLDLAHQIDVLDLITDLNRREGRTVVMVLHDLNLAARYADRLVAMRAGRIVAAGPPAEGLTEALLRTCSG